MTEFFIRVVGQVVGVGIFLIIVELLGFRVTVERKK